MPKAKRDTDGMIEVRTGVHKFRDYKAPTRPVDERRFEQIVKNLLDDQPDCEDHDTARNDKKLG